MKLDLSILKEFKYDPIDRSRKGVLYELGERYTLYNTADCKHSIRSPSL